METIAPSKPRELPRDLAVQAIYQNVLAGLMHSLEWDYLTENFRDLYKLQALNLARSVVDNARYVRDNEAKFRAI